MHEDDRSILKAWSRGEAGASARIARRAWAILLRDQRAHPSRLALAVGGAGEAARWFAAYDGMGLAGLVDAPRAGRPASALAEVTRRLVATGSGDGASRCASTRSLPRNEREALWRANRKTGAFLLRRHQLDLPLPTTPELDELLAVFIGPGLCVLASVLSADELLDHPMGTWLGVPRVAALRTPRAPDTPGGLPSVLTALGTTLAARSPVHQMSTRQRSDSGDRRSERLLRRFVCELAALAQAMPGHVQVQAVADLEWPVLLVEYFSLCRSAGLWTPVNDRFPSPLAWHGPVAHRGAAGRALQSALSRLMSHGSANSLGTLIELLRRPVMSPFAWVRCLTPQNADDGSNNWPSAIESNEDEDNWS